MKAPQDARQSVQIKSKLLPLLARKNSGLRRSVQLMEHEGVKVKQMRYLQEKRRHFDQLRKRIELINDQLDQQSSPQNPPNKTGDMRIQQVYINLLNIQSSHSLHQKLDRPPSITAEPPRAFANVRIQSNLLGQRMSQASIQFSDASLMLRQSVDSVGRSQLQSQVNVGGNSVPVSRNMEASTSALFASQSEAAQQSIKMEANLNTLINQFQSLDSKEDYKDLQKRKKQKKSISISFDKSNQMRQLERKICKSEFFNYQLVKDETEIDRSLSVRKSLDNLSVDDQVEIEVLRVKDLLSKEQNLDGKKTVLERIERSLRQDGNQMSQQVLDKIEEINITSNDQVPIMINRPSLSKLQVLLIEKLSSKYKDRGKSVLEATMSRSIVGPIVEKYPSQMARLRRELNRKTNAYDFSSLHSIPNP